MNIRERQRYQKAAALYTRQLQAQKCHMCGGSLEPTLVARDVSVLVLTRRGHPPRLQVERSLPCRDMTLQLCTGCPTPRWVRCLTGCCPECRGSGNVHAPECDDPKRCTAFLEGRGVSDDARGTPHPLRRISDLAHVTCYVPVCTSCQGTGLKRGVRRIRHMPIPLDRIQRLLARLLPEENVVYPEPLRRSGDSRPPSRTDTPLEAEIPETPRSARVEDPRASAGRALSAPRDHQAAARRRRGRARARGL